MLAVDSSGTDIVSTCIGHAGVISRTLLRSEKTLLLESGEIVSTAVQPLVSASFSCGD